MFPEKAQRKASLLLLFCQGVMTSQDCCLPNAQPVLEVGYSRVLHSPLRRYVPSGLRQTFITSWEPTTQESAPVLNTPASEYTPGLYLQESGSNSRAWWGMGGSLLRIGCVSLSWCIQHHHLAVWRPSSTPSLHRADRSLSSWRASPKPKVSMNCQGWALSEPSMSNTEPLAPSHTGQLSHDQACGCKWVSLLVQASVYNPWHICYCLQQAPLDGNSHTHCSDVWHRASWLKLIHCARANLQSSAIHPTSLLSYQIHMLCFIIGFVAKQRNEMPISLHLKPLPCLL